MDRCVIFTLEHIPAPSATARALGKRRVVSVGVNVQTLLPMLRIRQKVVCVFTNTYCRLWMATVLIQHGLHNLLGKFGQKGAYKTKPMQQC